MNKRNNFICEFSNKTKRQSRRASNKTQANNEHKKKIYSNLIEAIIQILLETLVSLLRSLVWNDSQRRRHRPQWERVRRHWMRDGGRARKKKKNSTWLRNRLFENLWGNFKALLVFCWLWSAARHSNGARRLQALLWYILRTHTHTIQTGEKKKCEANETFPIVAHTHTHTQSYLPGRHKFILCVVLCNGQP